MALPGPAGCFRAYKFGVLKEQLLQDTSVGQVVRRCCLLRFRAFPSASIASHGSCGADAGFLCFGRQQATFIGRFVEDILGSLFSRARPYEEHTNYLGLWLWKLPIWINPP